MYIHWLISDILLKPQAYLDPGSGSMLIQGLLAILLAGGLFVKMFWRKIFPKKKDKAETDPSEDRDDEVDADDDGKN